MQIKIVPGKAESFWSRTARNAAGFSGHKVSVLCSGESTFQIVFGNHERCVIQDEEENDHPQHTVKNPTSVMVFGCLTVGACGLGNLHICHYRHFVQP